MKIKNTVSNRNFGLTFFIFFIIISLWPLIHSEQIRVWSLVIAFIFLILGMLNSKILTPLNTVWFKFGLFLGKIVSPIVMGIIFFLIVTPISIVMKIFGKDLLNLKYNNQKSYWVEKNTPKSKMKNQF